MAGVRLGRSITKTKITDPAVLCITAGCSQGTGSCARRRLATTVGDSILAICSDVRCCLHCSALFSKNWQLREAALGHICRGLQSGAIPHDSGEDAAKELVRSAGPPLQRLLRDKVGSVVLGAQQVRIFFNSSFFAMPH